MQNELNYYPKDLTREMVENFIKKLRKEKNIIIENAEHDFFIPTHQESSILFGNYIIAQNQLYKELETFQKITQNKEPIAVEFIRWNNALNRFIAAETMDEDKMPDIVQVGSTWVSSFAKSGSIEDLSKIINEDEFSSAAIGSAKPFGIKGVFGAPWIMDLRVMFYHKDMIPNPDELFKSKENFLQNASLIAEKNPSITAVTAFPMAISWDLLHNLAMWLWGEDGDILKPRSVIGIPFYSVELDSKNSLKAIDYLQTLAQKGLADFSQINGETLEDNFLKRKYATISTGPWFISKLGKGWHKRIGISMPVHGHPFIGGCLLTIWHSSKQRGNFDNAVKLIQFFTGHDSQRRYSIATTSLSQRKDLIDEYLSQPEMKAFKTAFQAGRTYPAIPEWVALIENPTVRDQFWEIWQDIAQRKPIEVVHQTVKKTAKSLKGKVLLHTLRCFLPYGAIVFFATLSIGIFNLHKTKRRLRVLTEKHAKSLEDLEKLSGERIVLEATQVAMKRMEETHEDKATRLQTKIEILTKKEKQLKSVIDSLISKENRLSRPLDDVHINWDGTLNIEGKVVEFENNRQAKRLLEHLTRQAICGSHSVHCLIGYPLFGWKAENLKTPPNRLFETLVAKMNSTLKKYSLMPILVREQRGSFRWRLAWDRKKMSEQSSSGIAQKILEEISKINEEDIPVKKLTEILHVDPKCFGVYPFLLKQSESKEKKAWIEQAKKFFTEDIQNWKSGISESQSFLSNAQDKDIDSLRAELSSLQHSLDYMDQQLKVLSQQSALQETPLHLSKIINTLESIHDEIKKARIHETDETMIWSSLIQSDDFERLLAIPSISAIINNTYNFDIQSNEDPRLIQLAILKTYSEQKNISVLKQISLDGAFFKEMGKQVKNELKSLEQQLASMPDY